MDKDLYNIKMQNWYYDDQLARFKKPPASYIIEQRYNVYLKAIDKYLQRTKKERLKVLDAGCGDGINLVFLFENYNKIISVNAIDYNPIRVDRVKTLFPDAHVSVGNLLDLKFNDNSFDIIICTHVIEHIEDDSKALKEMNRVLKDDGILILGVPNEGCFSAQIRNNIFQREILKITDHIHFYTKKVMAEIIYKNNFKTINMSREGLFLPHSRLNEIFGYKKIGFSFLNKLNKVFPSQASGLIYILKKTV